MRQRAMTHSHNKHAVTVLAQSIAAASSQAAMQHWPDAPAAPIRTFKPESKSAASKEARKQL
eukprot:10323776-Lingulodinium_polyedra.AAC.1